MFRGFRFFGREPGLWSMLCVLEYVSSPRPCSTCYWTQWFIFKNNKTPEVFSQTGTQQFLDCWMTPPYRPQQTVHEPPHLFQDRTQRVEALADGNFEICSPTWSVAHVCRREPAEPTGDETRKFLVRVAGRSG